METRLSSKGQIVIPRQIRDNYGWRAGITFSIIDEGDSIVLKPTLNRKTKKLVDVIGCTGYSGPTINLDEMNKGILEKASRQVSRWSL